MVTQPINQDRLLERFLEYVRVNTTANPDTDEYPSSPGQWELGKLLVEQLKEMGLENVKQDEFALVSATLPAGPNVDCPVVAFNAHLDTSPETTGDGVQPQVIRDYGGGDIVLPGDSTKVITEKENPELKSLHGCTLITTDGTTLLGGDDKAGVAIIMESLAYLKEHSELTHGELRVLFTCDEEIGRGVDRVDVSGLGATVCYTLDGPAAGSIDVETFSADEATVTVRGVNIHPSIAKNRMVNAIRAAGTFLSKLPTEDRAPESTEGREGFLHPYRVTEAQVDEVVIKILLRAFDTPTLGEYAELLRKIGEEVEAEFSGTVVDLEVRQQYRNLGDGLKTEPRAVAFAQKAYERLNRPVELASIRGGTDGSRFTELGLPTPNLSSGQHTPHSPLEWACLDEMVSAVEVVVELAQVWASDSQA